MSTIHFATFTVTGFCRICQLSFSHCSIQWLGSAGFANFLFLIAQSSGWVLQDLPTFFFSLLNPVVGFCRICQLSFSHFSICSVSSKPVNTKPAKIASPVCLWDFSPEPSSPSLMPFNKSEWWWWLVGWAGMGMGMGMGDGGGVGGWVGGWALDSSLQVCPKCHARATCFPCPPYILQLSQ